MERFTIRPAPGVLVRDPVTLTILPEHGAEVAQSPFWLRRVAERSVFVVIESQIAPEPEPVIQAD